MARAVRFPEAVPDQVVFVPNTVSINTANRFPIRTIDATTTNFIVGGAHIITITLKLVDNTGAVVQGAVDVGVLVAGTTLANNAFAATTGTLLSGNNGATTPTTGSMKYLASTGGLITAVITTAGAGTASVSIQYGQYQVITTGLVVAA